MINIDDQSFGNDRLAILSRINFVENKPRRLFSSVFLNIVYIWCKYLIYIYIYPCEEINLINTYVSAHRL